MASFTKFGWNQYGELVYRNTGRVAPESYTVKGNTVYGKNGRKIGQIGKGTAKQQATIRKAATAGGRTPAASKAGRFSFNNIRKAREKALKTAGRLQLVTPKPTKQMKKNFGKSVRNMALLSVKNDPVAYQKIKMMKDDELMQLYSENQLVFDVYFDYGSVTTNDKGKGISGSRETAKNAQALIDVYEARYGTIPIQSTL